MAIQKVYRRSNQTIHHPAASVTDHLRVLLVTPRFLPFMGGVENHVYQVTRRLLQMGIDAAVLTADSTGALPEHEVIDTIPVHRVRAWPANQDYYFAPGIAQVITQEPWDIVHIQSYHTLVAPIAMWACTRAGIPYVVTFHGGGHSSRLRNLLRDTQRRLLRPLLAQADCLIATARFEIDFFGPLLQIPQDKFVFIPNGSDLATVAPGTTAHKDESLIASIGRLERYKGHHRILAALPYILEQRPDVCLWIAGSGPYESHLRHMAQKLGVAEHVDISCIPTKERARMAAALSKVSLVTLLSEYETHPMAALEAAAHGCSLVVADTSGLAELAEQGMARAIPLHSPPSMVSSVVLEELSQLRVQTPLHLSTWDACTSDLLALYRTVVGRVSCVS